MIAHDYIALLNRVTGMGDRYSPLYMVLRMCFIYKSGHEDLLGRAQMPGTQNKKGADEREAFKVVEEFGINLREIGFGEIFRQIHSCQAELEQLSGELDALPSASGIVEEFRERLDHLAQVVEAFIDDRTPSSLLSLLTTGSALFSSYGLTRTYSQAALEALAPAEEIPSGQEALTIFVPTGREFRDILDKLDAISSLYEEVCALLGVSAAEFPLQVSRVETGSLWMKLFGESRVIGLIVKLIENGALYIYRNFTNEGKVTGIPRQIEVTMSVLGLAGELKKAGVDTAEMDEVIRKASVKIAENLNTLVSGASKIAVNGQEHSVSKEFDKLLQQGDKTLRLTGETAAETTGEEQRGEGQKSDGEEARD